MGTKSSPKKSIFIPCIGIIVTCLILPCSCDVSNCNVARAELVFVVDSSGSIGASNFDFVKETLNTTLAIIQYVSDGLRVGIVVYSGSTSTVLDLTSNRTAIVQGVNSMRYLAGSTRTDLGIEAASNMILNNGRSGVNGGMVVITDGQSTFESRTISAATNAKSNKIYIEAVGITNNVNSDELNSISSTNAHFKVNTFLEFQVIAENVTNTACKGIVENGATNVSTSFSVTASGILVGLMTIMMAGKW